MAKDRAPNPELANELVNLVISPEMGGQFAKMLGFGPLNQKVTLDQETAATVVYGKAQIEKLTVFDPDAVNARRPAWTERWNKEIESQ